MITQDLGIATAYGYAKSKGYTGTEVEFAELMASYAEVGQTAVDAAETAITKASEASASASTAQTAANTATTKAGEASQSASTAQTASQTATTKASEASTSAQTASTKASEASQSAATASAKVTEATTAAATAVSAKDDAVSANTAAQSAKTAAQTAQTGAETAAASVQSSAAQIQTNADDISELKEDLTQKANIDGSYEDLVSGGAYQIISNMVATDTTPYNYRTAGGSLEIGDRMKLKEIVGGSLAVNQLVPIPQNDASLTQDGVTITDNRDGSFTVSTEEGGATANVQLIVARVSVNDGSKVVFYGCPTGGSTSTFFFGTSNTYAETGNGKMRALGNVNYNFSIYVMSGTVLTTPKTFRPQIVNFTAMFGTTIADYVYTLETATAGAGVAWLKSHFPRIFDAGYIPYNAGTLEHVSGLSAHKMVGFNQWDEEWEVGSIDASGNNDPDPSRIRSKNYIAVLPNTNYYFNVLYTLGVRWYAEDKSFISGTSISASSTNKVMESPSNAYYLRFSVVGTTTYKNDICINLSDPAKNGTYEPYKAHSYPLDSTLTLRGLFKLDANNKLYVDGDTYDADGTVTRRYGIVDLGTLSWAYNSTTEQFRAGISPTPAEGFGSIAFNAICTKYPIVPHNSLTDKTASIFFASVNGINIKDTSYTDAATFKAAMSGVMLVYELATPTTETADPYTEIQNVSNWGTEEFVTTSLVPVGHETAYQPDLRAKIEVAPESPDTDGLYLMKRENGQNSYVAYLGELPSDPTTDGTYTLKATVSSGTVTKTWEADT